MIGARSLEYNLSSNCKLRVILTDGIEEASEAGEIVANEASGIKDGRVTLPKGTL